MHRGSILLATLAALAAGCLQAPEAPALATPEVVAVEPTWGNVSADTTELRVDVTVHNPNPIPVPVAAVDYVVTVDGLQVGEGHAEQPVTLPANGDATAPVLTTLDNHALLQAFAQHIAQNETSTARIDGTLRFGVPGLSLPVPFERERTLSTDLAQMLAGRV
jgi:LEA14-like dessication related protein